MQGKENPAKVFQFFRQGDFKSAKKYNERKINRALAEFSKAHPLKKNLPNSSVHANSALIDYYSKPSLIPEEFLAALSISDS